MYVILTSKPGQYRTEVTAGLRPVEAYDYLAQGRLKAHFVIAELSGTPRVRVVDETEPPVVNEVPSKFLPKYESVEQARRELRGLTSFGSVQARLDPVAA